jgi:hypothetical protein
MQSDLWAVRDMFSFNFTLPTEKDLPANSRLLNLIRGHRCRLN